MSPEEQKLVGTWAVTQELPHPQMGVRFPKSTVIHFHPDRTAKLVSETFDIWRGNYEDYRRWEWENGILRETSGMRSITLRCTLVNEQTFRIDNANGESFLWRRYSTSPQMETRRVLDQEGSRYIYAKRENSGPMTEAEKFWNRPVKDFFPSSSPETEDEIDAMFERDRQRAIEQQRQFEAAHRQRTTGS